MATRAGAMLTEAHRLAQAKLSAQVVADLLKVWPLLDPTDLDATVDRWLTASAAIVAKKHGDSAALAREYLRRFRAVELGTPLADWTPPPAPAPSTEAIRTSMVVQGPVRIKAAMTVGTPLAQAVQTAAGTSSAAGSRHALNGGRDAIVAATKADDRAVGIRRVTAAKCCAFCAMLSSRSYYGLSSDATGVDMDEFKVHDGCHCTPETVYEGGSQLADRQSREHAAFYSEVTAGETGKDKNRAFRRAWEAQQRADA